MTTPNEELIEQLETALHEWSQYVEVDAAPRTLSRHAEPLISNIKHSLQAQAERIKELEDYRAKYNETYEALDDAARENTTLRAQLAAIAATEPVMIYHGRCVIDCGDSGHQDVTMLKMIARETKLFTRPMPAQDVTELVEALEKLARLGNGEHYGNSDGNMIARTALANAKGAK